MAERNVYVRLSVRDAEKAKAALRGFGDQGKSALNRIEKASPPARRGLKALDGTVSGVREEMRGFAASAGPVAGIVSRLGPAGLAAAAGVAAATAGFVAFNRAVDKADRIAKVSDSIGIATDSLQEYRFAAERSGVATATLDTGLQAFGKRLGELQAGSGELASRIDDIAPGLRRTLEEADSTTEALDALFAAMAGLEKQSDRAALSAAAFSRTAGVEMTNLVRGGTAELEAMRRKARDLGLVLDEELLRNAETVNDEMDTFGAVISAQASKLLLELAPAISNVVAGLTTLVGWANEAGEAIASVFDGPDEADRLNASLARVEQTLARLDSGELQLPPDSVTALKKEAERLRAELAALETSWRDLEAASQNALDPLGRLYPRAAAAGASASETYSDAVKKVIAELETQVELVGLSATEQKVLTEQRKAGAKADSAAGKEIAQLVRQHASLTEASQAQAAAEKERAEAFAEAEDAQQALFDRQRDTLAGLEREVEQTRRLSEAAAISAEKRREVAAAIRAENIIRERQFDSQGAEAERIREMTRALAEYEAASNDAGAATRDLGDSTGELSDQAKATQDALEQFGDELQTGIVDTVESAIGGMDDLSDTLDNFVDAWRRTTANILAQPLTLPIRQFFQGGGGSPASAAARQNAAAQGGVSGGFGLRQGIEGAQLGLGAFEAGKALTNGGTFSFDNLFGAEGLGSIGENLTSINFGGTTGGITTAPGSPVATGLGTGSAPGGISGGFNVPIAAPLQAGLGILDLVEGDIGSGVGNIAGAASLFLPPPFNIIGSIGLPIIGNLLGGAFEGGAAGVFPAARADIGRNLEVTTGFTSDGGDAGPFIEQLEAQRDLLTQLAGSLGLPAELQNAVSFGAASGLGDLERESSPKRLFVGGAGGNKGSFVSDPSIGTFESGEIAAGTLFKTLVSQLDLDELEEGVRERIEIALENSADGADPAEIAQNIQFAAGFEDRLKALNAGFQDLSETISGRTEQGLSTIAENLGDFLDKTKELFPGEKITEQIEKEIEVTQDNIDDLINQGLIRQETSIESFREAGRDGSTSFEEVTKNVNALTGEVVEFGDKVKTTEEKVVETLDSDRLGKAESAAKAFLERQLGIVDAVDPERLSAAAQEQIRLNTTLEQIQDPTSDFRELLDRVGVSAGDAAEAINDQIEANAQLKTAQVEARLLPPGARQAGSDLFNFLQGQGQFAFQTLQEDTNRGILPEATFDEFVGQQFDNILGDLDKSSLEDLQTLIQDFSDVLPGSEKALEAINEALEEFGDTAEDVASGLKKQTELQLRGQFENLFGEQGVGRQLNAAGIAGTPSGQVIADNLAAIQSGEADFGVLADRILAVAEDAETASAALQILSQAEQDVARQSEQDAQAVRAAEADLADAYRQRIALYQDERAEIARTADALQSALDGLADTRRGLQLNTNLSPLSAFERRELALGDIDQLAAVLSDPGADAAARASAAAELQQLAPEFLRISRDLFASGPAYADDFAYMQDLLESAEDQTRDTIDVAEDQLDRLDRLIEGDRDQLDALGVLEGAAQSIGAATRDVEAAILALLAAEGEAGGIGEVGAPPPPPPSNNNRRSGRGRENGLNADLRQNFPGLFAGNVGGTGDFSQDYLNASPNQQARVDAFLNNDPRWTARAAGGPVSAGQLYRVNELGVELFRPAMDGQILPHDRTAALLGAGAPTPGRGDSAMQMMQVRDNFARLAVSIDDSLGRQTEVLRDEMRRQSDQIARLSRAIDIRSDDPRIER